MNAILPAAKPRVLLMLLVLAPSLVALGSERDQARDILNATGFSGGLIVHLGCGDGQLTAALGENESHIVNGLDTDADNVAQARRQIESQGLYGRVAVERWTGDSLPYADNLVNLLVSKELGEIPMREVMRVLAPDGVAYLKDGDTWTKTVKPRPKDIDEWTHYLHDASGNAVAHDEVVGPPGRIQWIADPAFMRSHEHLPGIFALVSTGGRIFYLVDEAAISSLRQTPKWNLVARDGFNGTLLWKQPVPTWFPHVVNWGRTPPHLQRRLVAVDNRVYVTLGLHAPLSAVDAATGEIVKVYDDTEGTEEVIFHQGVLLLAVRSVTEERTAELAKWRALLKRRGSPLDDRDSAEPLVKRLRASENKGARAVLAIDADSGSLLWKATGADVSSLRINSLSAAGDSAFYQAGGSIVRLDLKTGQRRWAAAASAPMRLVYGGRVFCANGKTVTALSAENGQPIWKQDASMVDIRDAFVAGGSLWLGGFKPIKGKRSPAWGPYFATQRDLTTGEILMHVEPENPGHHHRCYSNKATDRYILGGRRGTEFIDLETGDVLWHSWARGVCRYGVMPSNGLLYAPPHACGCYMGAKLTGFNALAPLVLADAQTPGLDDDARFERGPAYGQSESGQPVASTSSDWPTYRGDAERSGSTRSALPAALKRRWQAEIGGKITAPTVADGRIFVASVDRHTVCAVDAESGQSSWRFTAGARVDSPPSLHQGRAIFGSHDGYVYSVQASDGELAWRFQAARHQRRVAANGQLESALPVLGSVLVDDGVIHLTAGRSSYTDGGIDLCRLEPGTGRSLTRTPINSPDPMTGKQPPHLAPAVMPGARADILSADGGHVYLRDMVFDDRGRAVPEGDSHLFALTGFLDDSWTHRSYWIFGTQCSISTGCSGRARDLVYGRLIVFDDATVYGYGRKTVHWSNQFQDGAYRLFAVKRGEGKELWTKSLPITVRAMVLAGDVIFLAGPPAGAGQGPEGPDASQPATLMAVSASDGAELAQSPLDCWPIFDGMAAASGQLYISLENGRLLCMAGD